MSIVKNAGIVIFVKLTNHCVKYVSRLHNVRVFLFSPKRHHKDTFFRLLQSADRLKDVSAIDHRNNAASPMDAKLC